MGDWQGYQNYGHYWWVNPLNMVKWYNEALASGFPIVGDKKKYCNVPAVLDIETTSFYKMGEKCATMYLWSFNLNGSTLLGRTWLELIDTINFLHDHIHTDKNHLVIYVHNLGYEFQFMRGWFKWTKVFAIKDRRPVHAVLDNGIEFKCSYILSNYSLAYIGAKLLRKYPVTKAVGDLDYSKLRHSASALTTSEIWYSVKDVQVIASFIQEKIENEGGVHKLPLTNTGYVRRYCREYCFTQFQKDPKLARKLSARYHEAMSSLQITSKCEYDQLHEAFAGGFTHAGAKWSGRVLHDVGSADLASSYPAVMVMNKFPMARGTFLGNLKEEDIEFLMTQDLCILFTVRLTKVEPKFIYENYVSASRCSELSKDAVYNNGRVAAASVMQLTVTEQDWDIIKQCYTWETAEFYGVRIYPADYLPRPFILSILHLFGNKTSLKGVEGRETEYMVSKNMINSAYGMSVTNIIRDLYEYSSEEGWVNSPANVDEQLQDYNNSYNRFLFYAWGVWVTAHARHNLWEAILNFGEDFVYADTDSIKGLNFDSHNYFFTIYNFRIEQKIRKASAALQIPLELFSPKTKSGIPKTIGVFEREENYKTFKTIGAKRYIYEHESGELWFTISGVNKYYGVPWLLTKYANPNYEDLYKEAYNPDPSKDKEAREAMSRLLDLHAIGEVEYDKIFEKFSEGLIFPAYATGKQTLTYIDKPIITELTDYNGLTHDVMELSYIHMEPQAYVMSPTVEYLRFLEGFRDASL